MFHPAGAVAKYDIDRKPHPEGVYLLGGFENENASGFKIVSSSQTSRSLRQSPCPGDVARQDSFGGFNHNCAGHVK